LLLLGHACWAYLTGRLVAYPLGIKPNLYLLLILGMLPDIDLILGSLGVQHRTITHSVVFWSAAFVPFFLKYRILALPYFVAVTQHILIGDLIVGKTNILWPLVDLKIGLGLPLFSPVNLILEGIGLVIFAALVLRSDRSALIAVRKTRLLYILALVPLAGFVIFASAGGPLISVLIEHSEARHLEKNIPSLLNNGYLQVATAMHLALILFMLVPLFQVRSASRKMKNQQV